MIAALQLSGKGERTQEAYVREVRLLSEFYHKSPKLLSEAELQKYFLHRKHVDNLAPNSMRICYSGIRFFYQHVLKRNWHILSLIRAATEHRLPTVLSVQEIRRLLKALPHPCTIRSTSPPSTASDSGSRKDFIYKSSISMPNA
jgi:integrase/recombinase XerD